MPNEGRGTPSRRSCLAVVLAAGEGTRMKSARPKVLHEIAGRSMLGHVLAAIAAAGATREAVVVGPGRDDVGAEARRFAPMPRSSCRASASARRTRCWRRARRSSAAPTTWSCLRRHAARRAGDASSGCGRRSPTARPSWCSASRPPTRPATAACSMDNGGLAAIREDKDASEEERRDRALQRRADGDPRRARAGAPRRGRQRQRQGRILPDRRRRDRPRARARRVAVVVAARGRGAGHQRPRRARRGRGGRPGAPAARGDARRRDADRARDGVLRLRHRDRAATSSIEPQRGLRAGRERSRAAP